MNRLRSLPSKYLGVDDVEYREAQQHRHPVQENLVLNHAAALHLFIYLSIHLLILYACMQRGGMMQPIIEVRHIV
jgi:hypothetical protein